MFRHTGALLASVAMLSGCGGGDGGGGGSASFGTPTATVTPPVTGTPAGTGCTLRERQDWAASVLREWYLFPETLPASLDPTPYATTESYIDALTATARSQRRDRFFTYLTSIAQEDAFYNSGSSAGFGIRLAVDPTQRRAFVSEAFEGAPALDAGIDRGTEIVAIGTSSSDLRDVGAIIAAEGPSGVVNALGSNTAGITRLLRLSNASGIRNVPLTKADYSLSPVSSRYGSQILTDGGRRVGYLNLRTFISTADAQLRAAFAQFREQGITDVIVDLRYNGGGLVSTADLLGDLLGRDRSSSDVQSYVTYRPEKSSSNRTRNYASQPQSIAPIRIAFIGTESTASASEFVINSTLPYLHAKVALIGTNTFGKPVGQVAIDKAACDDRIRVVAFATQNAARQGDYYDGLATKVEASCRATDDITRQLGDPQEASTRQALDFLAGRSCSPILATASAQAARVLPGRELLTPDRPDTAQREVPGLF